MRLGVCLVVVSLVLGLVSPPKAEAFALTTTAGVVALVGGFLAACGLPFLVKGMERERIDGIRWAAPAGVFYSRKH